MAYPRPTLPQELVDHIVDYLAVIDRESLLACSAAGRMFTHRARSHIFADIGIREGDIKESWPQDTLKIEQIKKLRQVLEENLHLGRLIRNFAIEGIALGISSRGYHHWLFANQDLPYIFQHLSALRTFAWRNSIGHFSWKNLNADVVRSFRNLGHSASNLVCLEFKRIADFPFNLLYSFPNLKEVRFRFILRADHTSNACLTLPSAFVAEDQADAAPEPSQIPLPFFLESASFVSANSILELLVENSRISPRSMGVLSRLQSLVIDASDIVQLTSQTMKQVSPTLRMLTIMNTHQTFQLPSQFPDWTVRQQLPDLSLLPALRELCIHAHAYPGHGDLIPQCMFRFIELSTNPSYTEQLSFNVDIELRLECVQSSLERCFRAEGWSQFDDVLMNPKFLALKLINVNFTFDLQAPALEGKIEDHEALGCVRTFVNGILPRTRGSPGVALEVTINPYFGGRNPL